MQNLSLGDYKGSRDTLQGALGGQYAPLSEIMNATTNYAAMGLKNIGALNLDKQHEAETLHNALQQRYYEDQLAQDAIDRKLTLEGEMASGEEDAMLEHAQHMYSLLSPEDQAKNAGWLLTMKANKGKGSPAYRKGRMAWNSEHGTDEALSLIKAQSAAAQKLPSEPPAPAPKASKQNEPKKPSRLHSAGRTKI